MGHGASLLGATQSESAPVRRFKATEAGVFRTCTYRSKNISIEGQHVSSD